MINSDIWIKDITEKLKNAFKHRLLFVGLQGSYVRGEAKESSDIDVVVVLDVLNADDLTLYRTIVDSMPEFEKACGFIGGRKELAHWPKYDLLQFTKETVTYYGSLEGILPQVTFDDVKQSIKNGAANLYHAACHTYVHAQPADIVQALKSFYKAAVFIVQMHNYVTSGQYVQLKKVLLEIAEEPERSILKTALAPETITEENAKQVLQTLISWCGSLIIKY